MSEKQYDKMVPAGSPPFLHKPILYTLGPTQPIQHTIVPPRAYYSTSVVLHEAVIYDTSNRSNMRRFYTAPNSTQTDSTRPRFNTNGFYTSVFLHIAGPAPRFPVSAHEYLR